MTDYPEDVMKRASDTFEKLADECDICGCASCATSHVFGIAAAIMADREARAEPVAWMDDGTVRAGSEHTSRRVVTAESKAGMMASTAASFSTPLYAAPPAPQVKVKALEWDGNRAVTPVGIYYVGRIGNDWTVHRGHTHAGDFYALVTGAATDFEAALADGKAAAQADYERRILPTLEPSPAEPVSELVDAVHDISAERQRQMNVEGWTPEHDDTHSDGAMARAAGTYAICAGSSQNIRDLFKAGDAMPTWPWDISWWKPTTRRRDLVKAGALIVAEIERLDRLAKHGGE